MLNKANSESPHDFIIILMNMCQKPIFISKEDPYLFDKKPVQTKFLQTIFRGLLNENLRYELRPLLKNIKTADEDLLDSLSLAMNDETEHQEKTSLKKITVNSADTSEFTDQEPILKMENLLIKKIIFRKIIIT